MQIFEIFLKILWLFLKRSPPEKIQAPPMLFANSLGTAIFLGILAKRHPKTPLSKKYSLRHSHKLRNWSKHFWIVLWCKPSPIYVTVIKIRLWVNQSQRAPSSWTLLDVRIVYNSSLHFHIRFIACNSNRWVSVNLPFYVKSWQVHSQRSTVSSIQTPRGWTC